MIQILDRKFELMISHDEIQEKVGALAERLNRDYQGTPPVMIVVLNGAFVFAADLVRYLDFQPDIQFAKYASYAGTQSTGKVTEVLGVKCDLTGRDVLIVEDIVDTGLTMHEVLPLLKDKGAKSVRIATMFQKPSKLRVPLKVDYVAMEIDDDFIVGYGLDYDGLGRNYRDIYKVVD